MTLRTRRRSFPMPRTVFVTAAAAGLPVGLLWWLLAPGGLNLLTRDPSLAVGTNPQVWLPRDLTLAGLFIFSGCLLAVFLTDKTRGFPQRDLMLGLAGALVGALLAWQTGILAARWFGAPADTSANASVAFSLRSVAVVLLWPGATAAAVFIISLLNLSKQGQDRTDGHTGSAPFTGSTAPMRKMDR
ncbi:hypothetical protein J7E83_11945 [Arthrobacter sp. ISL-48]|uniref:hypothetical protein n=1 Tax=Arthrobacter sp. ISL-48 TaxID=2819110 RepID=UPI001BE9E804|nr:hypothetical protein [Arthrobacter sp. ISL-48]MBT2532821.1 hypothetical protein [Arthrobacter sp. ISL-48]